jgi:cytochrome P450
MEPVVEPPRRLHHVRGLPFLGALHLLREDMHRRVTALHEEVGDVFTFALGGRRIWAVRDPAAVEDILVRDRTIWLKTDSPAYETLSELLGQGLVTAEGAPWLKHRRLAQPAFHRERIGRFMQTMKTLADDVADRFAAVADAGADIEVAREMLLYTQRVIGLTMLSVDLEGEVGQRLAEALDTALRAVEHRANNPFAPPLWVPTSTNRSMNRARSTLDELVYALIAERRAARARGQVAGKDGDLLDLLMDAVDEDTGATLSDEELRDDVMTIFLAGHETTSNLLSWTFVALGEHPELADALARELAGTDPLQAARPSSSPSLLDRVVDESMRWRPPVWTVDRVAAAPTTILGHRVERGDVVLVSAWALHRHPAFWPDPERFDPDRFLEGAVAGRPKLAFLPFLAGNRKCIGDAFALAEAKIALATWLPRFVVTPRAMPGEELAVTLRPAGMVPASVRRREASPQG